MTLDALASCRAIAFDKTGTLTTGQLTCIGVEALLPEDTLRINETVSVAYAMERNAVHPIAAAIMKYAETMQIKAVSLSDFKAVPGYGLQAAYRNSENSFQQAVYIGRPSYIADKLPSRLQAALLKRTAVVEEQGELLAVLVIDQSPFVFQFRDTPRPKISDTIQAIQKLGLSTVMLTGDHVQSARRIAEELAITEYHADLTPEDKLNYVSNLASKKGLAMIGDGVNDAPALARATVGICMGKVGNTAAIEAADVVLLHDNIELLDWLIGKAKLTQRIVKQNLTLATVAIICASLPALGGVIPLWLAVILHEGGTVLVGLNALRLLRN